MEEEEEMAAALQQSAEPTKPEKVVASLWRGASKGPPAEHVAAGQPGQREPARPAPEREEPPPNSTDTIRKTAALSRGAGADLPGAQRSP
eukprot:CAMPEP_0206225446 /NCGR_PEP_ID=MMETSP0047_2-20121206/7551_1 /ASSEMBLY_ACC=CAM_ASM_000192 /TAXON_ID=195065 /ORGANISM="Chroomonas mesostigmatica_cf, Strain CCMP1168" /LENGTH=89 /DNA_ID=CAMNT_0053648445 /DNA_START=157 /DNA_END=424 /DNA_ORIENTATION=-